MAFLLIIAVQDEGEAFLAHSAQSTVINFYLFLEKKAFSRESKKVFFCGR